MARIRYIKPGIMTNEDLCELGPFAYILFTGLWMLADRAGRLEDRPKRIKAEAMPLWESVCWKDVDVLLKNLADRHFIVRYQIGETPYIQITKWTKHQNPHVRESASEIPPPPIGESNEAPPTSEDADSCEEAQPRQCRGTTFTSTSPVGNGEWVMGNGIVGVVKSGSSMDGHPTDENPPPTKPKPPKKVATLPLVVERAVPRRPVARAANPGRAPAHKAEDVAIIRESLNQLAAETRMPLPDDDLVHRVLDAAGGVDAAEIHGALVALYKRNKFRAMYSWGFVPLVVGQVFRVA